jgi:hypothetical protein
LLRRRTLTCQIAQGDQRAVARVVSPYHAIDDIEPVRRRLQQFSGQNQRLLPHLGRRHVHGVAGHHRCP